MLAEGGGVGEKSGERGKSGKRTLERVVAGNSETVVGVSVGEGEEPGEGAETNSGKEEGMGSEPEPRKTSEGG